MGIVFQQPDPIGTSEGLAAAQGGGAVQQYNQDRQAQLQLLSMSQRAQEAQQANFARGNAANSESATQAGIAGQQQNRLADQFAQQQIAQADQHAQGLQAAAQMQANQFTYQDNLQLQRTQAGMTQLSQMHSSGEISDDEYQEGLSQLHGVAGPLLLRQQTAKAQAQKEQLDQAVQQGQHMAALQSADLGTRSQEFNKRIVAVSDGNGGLTQAWIDNKGNAHPLSELAGKQAGDTEVATVKPHAGVGSYFDFKSASAKASEAAKSKDPETGDAKIDEDVYKQHMAMEKEAADRFETDHNIEHYASLLTRMQGKAGGDLNQLKGGDLTTARSYHAELKRLQLKKTEFEAKDKDTADWKYINQPAHDDINGLVDRAKMFANKTGVARGSLFNFQGWQFLVDHDGNLLLNQDKKKPVSQESMMAPTPKKQGSQNSGSGRSSASDFSDLQKWDTHARP